ncbi:MAG: hypothetical protein PHS57_08700 [Alphaproteobacteria bacterium]|nr:hypothetical protein [Alphaproteobacteria bacterium]
MEAAAILALVAQAISVLGTLIKVGTEISPQAVALFNAINKLVTGGMTDEAVAELRAAIVAVNAENAALEDQAIKE